MIKGITVQIFVKTLTGTDPFGAPIYQMVPEDVEDVIVGEVSATESTEALDLYGKKLEYTLGIPKDDNHDWEDKDVAFFGDTFHTVGNVERCIEANMPKAFRGRRNIKVFRHGKSGT